MRVSLAMRAVSSHTWEVEMRVKNIGAKWLQFLIAALMLLGVSGSAGVFAQSSAPLPSTAQVIAQSVESVSGGSMVWQMAT